MIIDNQTFIQKASDIASLKILVAGLLIIVAAASTAFAISAIAGKYLDAASRQPEAANDLFNKSILFVSFVDAFSAIAIGLGVYLIFTSPELIEVIKPILS